VRRVGGKFLMRIHRSPTVELTGGFIRLDNLYAGYSSVETVFGVSHSLFALLAEVSRSDSPQFNVH
jgi:hypothetical protein